MKQHLNTLLIALAIILSAYFLGTAFKNRNKTQESIKVTGLGETDFTSNLIVWNGSFSKKNSVLKDAYTELDSDREKIKTYLISGVFRENQMFFKWYGGFYRTALKTFDYFFVQNESSKKLLQSIGFNNVKISGDTRFDRVASILERDNSLDFIEQFKNNTTIIVIGSSWPKDEARKIYHCSTQYKSGTNTRIKAIDY